MTTYKLIYFNVKGRGELSRFIFAEAGVKYEDKRVTSEEWAALKPTITHGGLPVLEVDGEQLSGSQQIARYLAEKFGLAGSNDFENATIASINDVIIDLMWRLVAIWMEKDESKKAELKKEFEETHVPKYFGILEKRAITSGAPEGWLYGGKLTWPDLSFYSAFETIQLFITDPLKEFPTLTKLKTSVESRPNIAKWLNERPKTDH